MALIDLKFIESVFNNKKITDLSDTPSSDGMDADALKAYFDYIPKTMIAMGVINDIIDLLSGNSGADNIGIEPKEGRIGNTVGERISEIDEDTELNNNCRHEHSNINTLNLITSIVKNSYDNLVDMFAQINGIDVVLGSTNSKIPTSKAALDAINEKIIEIGAGDMAKAIYDRTNSGKIDKAIGDEDGANIKDTYFKKTDIYTKPSDTQITDNTIVTVCGNETTTTVITKAGNNDIITTTIIIDGETTHQSITTITPSGAIETEVII